uniref:Dimer_Tnp_hAT domain-containing protein n=1 Tax=Rhodnius prolixus TaxID=13249 RepID=T1HWL8_RHOPR
MKDPNNISASYNKLIREIKNTPPNKLPALLVMAVGEDKESDDSLFDDDDDCINIFTPFAQKSANITEAWKTEIINYTKLDQAPVDVDILEWWKTLENSFKNLSRMATVHLVHRPEEGATTALLFFTWDPWSDGRVMGWRKANAELEKKNLQPTLKGFKAPPLGGGGSVMVWGWMSASGFGELVFIDGMMDKIVYSNILKNNLEKVPKNWVF